MLHTFFFILSFLMDYHAMADAFRDGALFGLVNASFVCVAVAWLSLRRRIIAANRTALLGTSFD